ncbi:MAG: hypothetical protein K6A30_06870 [Lachnospiraceae bacterium]|nr:hypothetical protein [Lachnospiraceae bacterium]
MDSVLARDDRMVHGKIPNEESERLYALGFIHEKGSMSFYLRIITNNGNVETDQLKQVMALANTYGNGTVTLSSDKAIEVRGIAYEDTEDAMKFCEEQGLITGGTGNHVRPIMVYEQDSRYNQIIDPYDVADKLRKLFFLRLKKENLPNKMEIAVGGGPNGCSELKTYDIGIEGVEVPSFDMELCRGCLNCSVQRNCKKGAVLVGNGELFVNNLKCDKCGECVGKCPFGVTTHSTKAYRIYIGGRHGNCVREGIRLSRLLTAEESLFSVIDRLIFLFQEMGQEGEEFADTIARIGVDTVERKVLA